MNREEFENYIKSNCIEISDSIFNILGFNSISRIEISHIISVMDIKIIGLSVEIVPVIISNDINSRSFETKIRILNNNFMRKHKYPILNFKCLDVVGNKSDINLEDEPLYITYTAIVKDHNNEQYSITEDLDIAVKQDTDFNFSDESFKFFNEYVELDR